MMPPKKKKKKAKQKVVLLKVMDADGIAKFGQLILNELPELSAAAMVAISKEGTPRLYWVRLDNLQLLGLLNLASKLAHDQAEADNGC